MKVLYAVSEAYPFIMTGGLGDVGGSLPRAIREKFIGCRVVLPLYSDIPKSYVDNMKLITSFDVMVGWRRQYCGVYEIHINKTIYYFIDNEYYFKRSGIYGHYDDAERFAFFSLAVLEMLKYINYEPDIIQANDWHTALIPVYMKLVYQYQERYMNIKTIFTIHNILYQGKFDDCILQDVLGLEPNNLPLLEFDGCINLMKAAIETADAVTTVSPTYARELTEAFYACGLDNILMKNEYKLSGIINGIDMESYNPETDDCIISNYSIADISGKADNKTALQKLFNLPVDLSIPLIGMVTRLVDHKGMDLINCVIEDILSHHIQLIILGTGDALHETLYYNIAKRYPGKFAIKIGFIPDLAHKIYAGADMFLMPSKTEPCGLSQMVSLRYGTIPIVRETGGLKDTVRDCGDKEGFGFTFKTYNAHDMLDAINRAITLYGNAKEWEALVYKALACEYSWQSSAGEYVRLYRRLLKKNKTIETKDKVKDVINNEIKKNVNNEIKDDIDNEMKYTANNELTNEQINEISDEINDKIMAATV